MPSSLTTPRVMFVHVFNSFPSRGQTASQKGRHTSPHVITFSSSNKRKSPAVGCCTSKVRDSVLGDQKCSCDAPSISMMATTAAHRCETSSTRNPAKTMSRFPLRPLLYRHAHISSLQAGTEALNPLLHTASLCLTFVAKLDDMTASIPSREKHARKRPFGATAIFTIGSRSGSGSSPSSTPFSSTAVSRSVCGKHLPLEGGNRAVAVAVHRKPLAGTTRAQYQAETRESLTTRGRISNTITHQAAHSNFACCGSVLARI